MARRRRKDFPPPPPPTEAQRALAPVVTEEWIRHGLAVGAADRVEAEAGVRELYGGLPERMVWLGSPMAGLFGAARLLAAGTGVKRRWHAPPWLDHYSRGVTEALWSSALSVPCDTPEAALWPFLSRPARDGLWGPVAPHEAWLWRRLERSIRDAVAAQVGSNLWGPVESLLGDAEWALREFRGLSTRSGTCFAYAPYDVLSYAVPDFGYRCGLRPSRCDCSLCSSRKRIPRHGAAYFARYDHGVMRIARSAGWWWWLFRNTAILTERPVELHRDAQGRPHCVSGPAIRYPDGWAVWAWHGTVVPPDLIEEGWTAEQIMQERNSELRRCAVEATAGIYGWGTLIREAGWQRLGEPVPDPGNPGQVLTLWCTSGHHTDTDEARRGHVHLLHMTNGTPERDGTRREYGETVPGSITDPLEAAAWQIGLHAEHYAKTVRRT